MISDIRAPAGTSKAIWPESRWPSATSAIGSALATLLLQARWLPSAVRALNCPGLTLMIPYLDSIVTSAANRTPLTNAGCRGLAGRMLDTV